MLKTDGLCAVGRGEVRQLCAVTPTIRAFKKIKKQKPMDHVSDVGGYMGSFHYCQVHKRISVQEGMEVPRGKIAVDKEHCKIEESTDLGGKKVKSKAEVIHQAQQEKQTFSQI